MNRRNVVRLALAAALFGATIPGAALAQDQGKWWNPRGGEDDQQQSDQWTPPAGQQQSDRWTPPDGQGQYDPRSQRGGWDGNYNQDRFHRDLFEGRWVARDRFDTDDRGGFFGGGLFGLFRGGNRVMSLPNYLTIDQGRRMVRVADGANRLLQVIDLDNDDDDAPRFDRSRATFLEGDLRGNRLVATGTDARGRQMRQVMMIRDGGNTLVVRTQVQRGNSGRVVQVEKVYQRA
ncbi:MAG: hypothetical protein ACM3PF_03025 [Bacteroidota bacterium]